MRCDSQTCKSGTAARWQPVLVLRASQGAGAARAATSLRLCDTCKTVTSLQDVLNDAGWRRVLATWPRSKPQPQRHLTRLDFDYVRDDERQDETATLRGFRRRH